MKSYVYAEHGPLSSVTLSDGTEVILFPGATVELPEANPYTQALIEQDLLAPEKPATKTKPKEKASGS